MALAPEDARRRFSGRVEDYVRYRPSYPDAVGELAISKLGLRRGDVVADVGAGTGILSRLLLRHGLRVFAIEPNPDMRAAAGRHDDLEPIEGTAEATTLPDASVDLVAAGQAFHWFDAARAAAEARRIGRPGVRGLVCWNARRVGGSALAEAYERFLHAWGTDYAEVAGLYDDQDALRSFFGERPDRVSFPNAQRLDLDALRGRVRSVSYLPGRDDPRHTPMMDALTGLFNEHAEHGVVPLEYDTVVYFGVLRRAQPG